MQDEKIKTKKGTIIIHKSSQESPYRLYKKKFKTPNNKNELAELKKIILKYNPNYNENDIKELYQNLANKGCTYTAITNAIVEQLNYDDKLFSSMFGYSMYKKDGTIDYNKIMVNIFACLNNIVKIKIHQYKTYKFTTIDEATSKLLNTSYKTELEARKALFYAGWQPDGIDKEGKLIYKSRNFIAKKTLFGTYSNIAKEIFGIDNPNLTKEQLIELLKNNNMNYDFEYEETSSKLSGLLKCNNLNLWINKFFELNNISLKLEATTIKLDNRDYESFILELSNYIKNGYSIYVSTKINSDVWMTNGKKFGYTKPSTNKAGHQMTLAGFNQNKDILVNSWGEIQIINKRFYNQLEYEAIKILDTTKTKNKRH